MNGLQQILRAQAEGKAIAPNPFLLDQVTPITTSRPGYGQPKDRQTRLTQREAKRHLDGYGGQQAIDHLMNCVDYVGDNASAAPYQLYQGDKKLYIPDRGIEREDGQVDAPSDLINLLNAPNPFMDYMELLHLLIVDLLLVGNAYWYKWQSNAAGKPLALYRLAPPYVKIEQGPMGPQRYIYQPQGQRDPLYIDPKELLHFKRPNPHSAYYGLGIVQGGGRPFDVELSLTDTQASYYENKADPSLIVQSDRRVPRDVFNKLRAQLRARVAGSRKAGELLVLEAGLTANSLSPNAKDALFDTLTKMSRDRIHAMFKLAPALLGIIDEPTGAIKLSDLQQQFDTKTMLPLLKRLSAKITDGLVSLWDLKYSIDYSYVMPLEELLTLAGTYATLPGIKIKEIRKFVSATGIPESTGDPTIDELVINLPGVNAGPDGTPAPNQSGQPALADKPLPGEPGRPPKPSSTAAIPGKGAALPAGAAARRPQGKALIADLTERMAILSDSVALEGKALTNKLPGEQRPQDPLERQRLEDIDAVAASLEKDLNAAAHVLERALLDHVEGKAYRPNDVLKRVRNSPAWATFRSSLTAALTTASKAALSTAAVHQGSIGHTPDEEFDYDAIAASVVNRPNGGVRSIVATLKKRVADSVRETRDPKDPSLKPDVDKAVRDALVAWNTDQAPAIALTEATESYNEGTLTVAEATGHSSVLVSDGHDHDEACAEADGQVWSIEKARENRTQHPRCRRAFIAYAGPTP